ncbi:hypothetical protein IEO21_02469 [Rhodonia placenta]|uniref:RING-type domain-containing protein n=1 Tax=Rhodonia placenta TaxID=104341 RepID=A0A8H7U4H1_9APHY|nr:hypothetical protein IEO21_02469 [Postia placenta]
MSNTSATSQELDFWEFVNCSRCHLPFATDSGTPPVPFWLTECGHVLCNNHLNADQSCAQCGSQGIQLIPLQREMDAPMSDWFQSVTVSLDAVAYATRFQMETLARLVRHYKDKYARQRGLLERLKEEYKNIKSTVNELRLENQQLRQYADYDPGVPSEVPNMNRKRQMVARHQHLSGARTNSSPRTVMTPVGPSRLTLPPDHQQPAFPSHGGSHSDDILQEQSFRSHAQDALPPDTNRPGSRRFAQQYAYMPPPTPQAHATQARTLTYAQAAPTRQAAARQVPNQAPVAMLRPPAKPGASNAQRDQVQMPPPPAPQLRSDTLQQRGSFRPPMTPQQQVGASSNSCRFIPGTGSGGGSDRFGVQDDSQTRRFLPSSIQPVNSERFPGATPARSATALQRASGVLSRSASMALSGAQQMHFKA